MIPPFSITTQPPAQTNLWSSACITIGWYSAQRRNPQRGAGNILTPAPIPNVNLVALDAGADRSAAPRPPVTNGAIFGPSRKSNSCVKSPKKLSMVTEGRNEDEA